MSTGDPYAVGAFPESTQDEFWAHTPGAWYPDYPDIGRVLHSAHTGKIGSTIAAPVTQESYNFCLFFRHY
jgi:hypothetical protein